MVKEGQDIKTKINCSHKDIKGRKLNGKTAVNFLLEQLKGELNIIEKYFSALSPNVLANVMLSYEPEEG